MIDILQAMPNDSAILITITLSNDFKPTQVENLPYSVNLSILGEDEDALNALRDYISTKVNIDVRWRDYKFTLSEALSKLKPSPLMKLLKLKIPKTTMKLLRDWLILPDSKVSRCIPRGTVPAEVVSRSNGFRIGVGIDGHEFKLAPEDFQDHCIIIGENYDLVANIVKNLREHGTVIVIDYEDTISEFLRSRGVDCLRYPCTSISVNPFDLPKCVEKDLAIDILVNILEKVFNTSFEQSVKKFLKIVYSKMNPSPRDLVELMDDLFDDKLNVDYEYYEDLQELYNSLSPTFYFIMKSLVSNTHCTDISIEETLRPNTVVVFEKFPEGSVSLFYAILIRYLTEIYARDMRAYFVINHYPASLHHLLSLRDVKFILLNEKEEEEDKRIAGLTFELNGYEANVWINNDEGPVVVKIDRLKPKPAKITNARKISAEMGDDYREVLFGPALRYIDPEDVLRSLALYSIYKRDYGILKRIKDAKSKLSWLLEKGFISVTEEEIKYKRGFEKWFKSAIPSVKGVRLIPGIVDYYFTNNYCVVPVKQKPGMQRPDLVAIRFNPDNMRIRYRDAIAIEVEAHANKGERTREQIKINMIKNREFKEIHVWAYEHDKEEIIRIYEELDDEYKSMVKLFFCKVVKEEASTNIDTRREDQAIRVEVNGKIYELEPDEAAIKLKEVVEDIKKGRRKLRVVEKDGYLRVVDDRGIKLIEAKIKSA